MSQKIEIDVAAKLNTQQAESAAKRLGAALNQVSRQKVELVPDSELEKVKEAERLWRRYLALDKKLANGLRSSGQQGLPFGQADLAKAGASSAKINRINDYLQGGPLPTPSRVGMGGAAGIAAGGARSAATPSPGAGGGGGLMGGFGAGIAGLLGGVVGFGLSKIVGGAMENVSKAEQNNISYDRLKRTLGDVNVSFSALKSVVTDTGDGLRLSYGDTAQLATQFTKAGNLRGADYRSLPEELGLGVGLSRAYGLDPSQGVGTLGGMRGVGVTTNTQETRSMALLIGETIAKSDAFAKADEVMEAISSFAIAQTRQSLSVANTGGFAGMFSAMVGSGIAGMDTAGASNILSRMNSSLSAGGAKGEASQFLTAMVGNRMGLDPLQTQILREGGMFASNDSAFGEKSAYARYMGKTGPGGSQDFLSATRGMIEEKYAGNSDYQKMMRANAFANHTGLNMNQAMAMMSIKPNEMGQLQKYAGDMSTLSASGINNMALSLFGNDEQRSGIRDSLLARSDLKNEDRDSLNAAFGPNGSVEQQKEVLAKLSAQYEQEKTTGTAIQESRALLDNIKTSLADKIVPVLEASRSALIYLAGGKDGTSLSQMQAKIAKNEAKSVYDDEMKRIGSSREELTKQTRDLQGRARRGEMSSFDFATGMRDLQTQRSQLDDSAVAAKQRLNSAYEDVDNPSRFGPPASAASKNTNTATTSTGAPAIAAAGGGGKVTKRVSEFVKEHGPLADKLSKELDVPANAILGQWGLETGWGKSVIAGTNNLGNIKDFSGKGPGARDNMTGSWDSYRQYDSTEKFGDDFKNLLGKKRYAGALGTDSARDYFAGLKKGGYAEDPNYVSSGVKAANMAARARAGTPIPEAKSTQAPGNDTFSKGANSVPWPNVQPGMSFDPLTVIHQDMTGKQVAPQQELQVRMKAPAASFADRFTF